VGVLHPGSVLHPGAVVHTEARPLQWLSSTAVAQHAVATAVAQQQQLMQVELVQNVMLQGREAWRQMVVLTQQLVLPGRWESATAEVEKFHTNMQQFAVKNAEFIAAQALQQTRVKERDAIAKERTDMLLAYAEFSSVSQALAQALRAQGDTSRGAAEFIRQASIRQALISKLQNACRLMARYEAGKWHLEILKANTQRMDLNTQVVMASELARGRVDLLEKREVELASLVVHHHPRPVAPAPPLLMRPWNRVSEKVRIL